MLKKLLFCGLILACFFVPISPFGGSFDLAGIVDSTTGYIKTSSLGAKLGTSVASCDFNGDGKKDVIIGAPDANSGDGLVLIIFGGSDFSTLDVNDPAATGSGIKVTMIGYTTGFGTKVVCLGDMDGDLDEEIAIGPSFQDQFVVFKGSNTYTADIDLFASLLYPDIYLVQTAYSLSLTDIAGLGDITGDGTGDLIVSIESGGIYSAHVIYDVTGSNVYVDSSIPSTMFRISNGVGQTAPMTIASAGKFNDDDFQDFAVGNLNGGAQVAVIFGMSGGGYSDIDFSTTTYSLTSTPQVLFVNADVSYGLGASMTYAGDFDADGFSDLLIGAPAYNGNAGAAFIIRGSDSFTADISITDIPGSGEGYKITHGTSSGLSVGSTVFGSLTSDTFNVAVCDSSTSCYIIFGTATPSTIDLDAMESEDGFKIFSSSVSVTNPMQIAAIGSTNPPDTYGDFVIGQGSASGTNGIVYVMLGPNKCTSPCKTCSSLAAADWATCLTCETGFDHFYDSFCYSTCPSHSYPDSSTSCTSCHANCLECSSSGSTDCTSCDTSGSLPLFYDNECVASCPSGSYQDSATTCADCDGNCLECTGTDTFCTSCDTGGAVPWLYNNECVASCPSHSYQNSATTCATCHSRCLECNTAANTCTSCNSGGSYPLFYNSNCYGSCPSQSYQDSATTCADCDGNCLDCAGSSTTCTSCDPAGSLPLLKNSACYSSCPSDAPYVYSSACYAECPSGTAADSNKNCVTVVPEVPKAVQALSSTDEARQISNEVMSIISSFAFAGVHSIRSQTVQSPVSYFVFLNVDYPENYDQYGSSNVGSSNLPNPFKNTGQEKAGRVESINSVLANQSLLANIGYAIIFLIACIFLILLSETAVVLVEKHKKDYKSKRYYRLIKWCSVSLRWSFLLNQFISKYQDLAFFSFLGVYNAGGDDAEDTLNLVVCTFGFLITIAGLVGVFFIIKTATKKLELYSEEEKEKEEYTKNDFLGRRLVLYKDLKKDGFMTMLYPFFLMLRVFGLSFVTIFFWKLTALQLVFMNLCAILMFVYLIKYRPLEERGQFWTTMAYEIVAFVALFGVTILAIYNVAGGTNVNTKTCFGYLIIIANVGMLILNFISFGLEICEYVSLVYKKGKLLYQHLTNKKKKRITPEPVHLKNSPFISPSSSFIKEKELDTHIPIQGTPSVLPEGLDYLSDNSPENITPQYGSEISFKPTSSESMHERLSLLKVDSPANIRRNLRKNFSQFRQSQHIPPAEEIPEVEA